MQSVVPGREKLSTGPHRAFAVRSKTAARCIHVLRTAARNQSRHFLLTATRAHFNLNILLELLSLSRESAVLRRVIGQAANFGRPVSRRQGLI